MQYILWCGLHHRDWRMSVAAGMCTLWTKTLTTYLKVIVSASSLITWQTESCFIAGEEWCILSSDCSIHSIVLTLGHSKCTIILKYCLHVSLWHHIILNFFLSSCVSWTTICLSWPQNPHFNISLVFILVFVLYGLSAWGKNIDWGCLRTRCWTFGPKREEIRGG
jgi:hypothetical protein